MTTRRDLLKSGGTALAAATLWTSSRARAGEAPAPAPATRPPPPLGYTPVVTPNNRALPFHLRDGVKVFHLVAEPVQHTFAPGLDAECWGYNGSTPGPTLEVVEDDRVRIYVTNKLPEPTTVHWHGVLLESGMDGVAGLNQPAIEPGETFRYELTFREAGTYMYHPHYDEMTQMALGMMGMLIVHPRRPTTKVDRDFALMLSEWQMVPGARRPNPLAMADFNVLTLNSKAFPATEPLVVQTGDRVRIRFGNLSAMDHHPIHLHGYRFHVTATDGGPIRPSAQQPETTVLVPVGSTRDIEFVANAPGDWAMHCHMTHHVMNQMGHDIPNLIGADVDRDFDARMRKLLPGYMTMGTRGMGGMSEMRMKVPDNSIPMLGGAGPYGTIDMGGMFTILKVRDRVDEGSASSWHQPPAGTLARRATADELRADGVVDRS